MAARTMDIYLSSAGEERELITTGTCAPQIAPQVFALPVQVRLLIRMLPATILGTYRISGSPATGLLYPLIAAASGSMHRS